MQRNPFRAKAPIPSPGAALRGLAFILAMGLAMVPGHALWTGDGVTAFKVADKSIKMDGRPDSVWRAISTRARSTVAFTDSKKMVVLQPVKARNDDPGKYVPNPVNGSATLLAAYDSEALYFFFLIKTKSTVANPTALGCSDADLWRADAAEIFVDPSPWSADPATYPSYFTADATGLVYGTSPKTIQLDKPISHIDSTRYYFRNRATGDKFAIPAAKNPAIIALSSRHTTAAPGVRGVEIKLPFWTAAANFAGGKSMFLSWGFNLYMDSLWTNCASNPLGYRWAKHAINYDAAEEKPPGWLAGDSTHYDPIRSWDGWGRLTLDPSTITGKECRYGTPADFNATWDIAAWANACNIATAGRGMGPAVRLDAAGMPVPSGLRSRDARGRALPSGFRSPAFRP